MLTGKQKYSGNSMSQWHFFQHKWQSSGRTSNPDLSVERLATNGLSSHSFSVFPAHSVPGLCAFFHVNYLKRSYLQCVVGCELRTIYFSVIMQSSRNVAATWFPLHVREVSGSNLYSHLGHLD